MGGGAITMLVTLQFLENAKKKHCSKHRDDYEKCIGRKSNSFEGCHVVYMTKFLNCMKSIEVIEKMKLDL